MSLLDWFANRNKGETDASLKQKGIREFKGNPRDVKRRGADLQKAQEQFGGDFDIIDDPAAEAEAKRLAEEAKRKAEEEVERQEMERFLQWQEEQAEKRRQEKLLAVARGWQTRRAVSAALPKLREERWNTFLQKYQQGHKDIDTLISGITCWRCGQKGRLPVEDATLLGSPREPRFHTDMPIHLLIENYERLLQARRKAVKAWIQYNNRRLPVEKLRLDACYHPQLSHRYQLSRDCEVCGSQGMFHAAHFPSIHDRWKGILANGITKVPGSLYGENWIAMSDLSKDQAKFWLKAVPRPETRTRETHEYLLIKEDPELTLEKFNIHARPDLYGKQTDLHGTHQVYKEGSFFDKLGGDYEVFVKNIRIPSRIIRNLQLHWPDIQYWQGNPQLPASWKGGPAQQLYIKPGVEYTFEQQDPLCKEPRKTTSPPASKLSPRVNLLHELKVREGFWMSQLK